MPSGGMQVDPQSIMQAGDRMLTASQRIRDEVTAFQGELARFGEPWGTDDLGSLIGMVYQTIAEVAFECYADNAAEIDETGAATREMATGYVEVEDANTTQAQSIMDALGG